MGVFLRYLNGLFLLLIVSGVFMGFMVQNGFAEKVKKIDNVSSAKILLNKGKESHADRQWSIFIKMIDSVTEGYVSKFCQSSEQNRNSIDKKRCSSFLRDAQALGSPAKVIIYRSRKKENYKLAKKEVSSVFSKIQRGVYPYEKMSLKERQMVSEKGFLAVKHLSCVLPAWGKYRGIKLIDVWKQMGVLETIKKKDSYYFRSISGRVVNRELGILDEIGIGGTTHRFLFLKPDQFKECAYLNTPQSVLKLLREMRTYIIEGYFLVNGFF